MLEFLFSPIDTDRVHLVGTAVSWHGRFMVLAWGFLLPLGVVAARYFKVLPGQDWPREIQNPFWYISHRVFQYSGLVCTVIALPLILMSGQEAAGSTLHSWFGWSVVFLAGVQYLGTFLKGTGGGPTNLGPDGKPQGDHFTMSSKRVQFEWTHKLLGYLLILISAVSIVTGLWIANGYTWMWIGLAGWWTFLAITCVFLQNRGMAVDTYQAIWGTDPRHPGNAHPPIGWGIRRGKPVSFDETINIKRRRLEARKKKHVRH